MDALSATNPQAAEYATPPEKKPKVDELEKLFKTRDPLIIPKLCELEKKRFGYISHHIDSHETISKIFQIALNCLGLAREEIDANIAANPATESFNPLQVKKSKEAAQAINATLKFLEVIKPEERYDNLIKALLGVFWQAEYAKDSLRFHFEEEKKIIQTPLEDSLTALFKTIPPDQHLEILTFGIDVCLNIHSAQSTSEISAIFEALWSIPKDEREEIFKLTWLLIDTNSIGSKFAVLFKEVYKLPKDQREAVVQSGVSLTQKNCNIDNQIRILHMFLKLSCEERKVLAEDALYSFSGYECDRDGSKKADFIQIMLLLPPDIRKANTNYVRNYCSMVPCEARKAINFTNVTPEHLVAILQHGTPLCEIYYRDSWSRENVKSSDYVELYNLLITIIDPLKLEKYTQLALKHSTSNNPTLRNRVDFLETLLLLPQEQREAATVNIGKFVTEFGPERRRRALQFLYCVPTEDRSDVFNRGVSTTMGLPSHKHDELVSILQKTDTIPLEDRDEVFSCIWMINDSLYKTVDCIDAIHKLPQGKRKTICEKLMNITNKLMCVNTLGKMPFEQIIIIIKHARALKPQGDHHRMAPAYFVKLMGILPEEQRIQSLRTALNLHSKLLGQDERRLVNYFIENQLPELRFTVCAWFSQQTIETIKEECEWLKSLRFDDFKGTDEEFKENRSALVKARYADKKPTPSETQEIPLEAVEDDEDKIFFGRKAFFQKS